MSKVIFLYEGGKSMTELSVIEAESTSHLLWFYLRYLFKAGVGKKNPNNSIISSETKILNFLWFLLYMD